MTAFDFGVLAIIGLSTLFAFLRGVVRELIALVTWIAGVILALTFEGPLAALIPGLDATPVAKHVIAFAVIFIGVLIAGGLVAFAIARMVRAVGLGFVDRFLGAVFGAARGALIAVLLVLVAGLTALPRQEWWQNASLAPMLVTAALALRPWLPTAWAERLDYTSAGRAPGGRPGAGAPGTQRSI